MFYLLNHCQYFTGLHYIWVTRRVSDKKQELLTFAIIWVHERASYMIWPNSTLTNTHCIISLAFNCIYGFISLNNSWLRDYFSPIFLLAVDLTNTNNAASSAWHLELCPEKLTRRVAWERQFVSKWKVEIFLLWAFHFYIEKFQQQCHMDYLVPRLKRSSGVSVACGGFLG
jgi:hypothetical protein